MHGTYKKLGSQYNLYSLFMTKLSTLYNLFDMCFPELTHSASCRNTVFTADRHKSKCKLYSIFSTVSKKMVVPSYLVKIPGSDFPARLMISLLSTVRGRVQAEGGAWKEKT